MRKAQLQELRTVPITRNVCMRDGYTCRGERLVVYACTPARMLRVYS